MRKRVICLLLMTVVALSLSGCNGKKKTEESEISIPVGEYYSIDNPEHVVRICKDSIVYINPEWSKTADLYSFPRTLDEVLRLTDEGIVVTDEMKKEIRSRIYGEFSSEIYQGKEFMYYAEMYEEYPSTEWITVKNESGVELDFLGGSYELDTGILWIAGSAYRIK